MKKRIRIAIVGCGYWGKNLIRNLATHPACELVGLSDNYQANLQSIQSQYSHIPSYNDYKKLLQEKCPDALVIATPPDSHCTIALDAMRAGAHVLIEKPMATSSQECDEILEMSERTGKTVMIDNTLLYYPPVMRLMEIIHEGHLGDLLFYDSTRVNFGGFQNRANVLWDLAPHEFSILDRITHQQMPEQIVAIGAKHFNSTTESMCYLNLKYQHGLNAHLNLNWAAPIKFRQMIVGGNKQMAVLNDSSINDKVRVYDRSVNLKNDPSGRLNVEYHTGDVVVPEVRNQEALQNVITEFTSAIAERRPASSDGYSGARVVKILEAASQSLSNNGQPVFLGTETTLPIKRAS